MEINSNKKARYREIKSYKFTYSNRETGEVLLEGVVAGYTKSDCKKKAHNEAMRKGLKPMLDDNIKFYITVA